MTNALMSDVEARAEIRRTRTRDEMWADLATQSWQAAQAATDPAIALRWLERTHRMVPKDDSVTLRLATALLDQKEFRRAAALFQRLAARHDLPEAWAGLAACAHLQHDPVAARHALVAALRSGVLSPMLRNLARAVAGHDPWCGLTLDGVLSVSASQATIRLDGTPVTLRPARGGGLRLPPDWRRNTTLEVDSPRGPALGSPLPLTVFAGVEAFVEARTGGVAGWAWHRADVAADPVLHLSGPLGTSTVTAHTPASDNPTGRPLARPRLFALDRSAAAALGHPLAIRGPDGRHILGSPIDPAIEARAAADPAHAGFSPIWADVLGPSAPPRPALKRPVDVVIPVYRGAAEVAACLGSVLASLPRSSRVIVVDDASPEPAVVEILQRLTKTRRITLLRLPENRGFPGAANAGLEHAAGRDVVLLNADTLVPPGWLERLRAAAYSAPDIASVTPLTNDGTILSYPDANGGNPVPDLAATIATDALAQQANAATTVDLPVGVGFCLYLRRDCLDEVGLLREDLFAQGYGEENDLCLRARHRGWRHVAAPGVFVAHVGATSFGGARAHLAARNGAILNRLHPGYDALVAAHIAADPLAPARRRMDELRWAAGRKRAGATLFVTHAGGGGVDRVVDARAAEAARQGLRPILLRPRRTGPPVVQLQQPGGTTFPNLVFPMPQSLPALLALLRADRPRSVELHHTLGHHADIASLAARLRVEQLSVVHDFARFCPRIALVGPSRRYCGEPDVDGCIACIADLGSLLEDDPPVPLLLERSAAELARSARVLAPSPDAAARIARHFPGIWPEAEPWDDDGAYPPLAAAPRRGPLRVVVVGALGVEKGFEVLLACARDARARNLPLAFTVVGYTADDERLMAAGPVFITSEYAEADAVPLIRSVSAQLAFIPSIWPETWCFALTRAWQAGLPAAVFDIGAQAERVRKTGRGWVLPLGLAAKGLNDALLRLAPDASASQCPPRFD